MEISDYSKRLAQTKADYSENADKLRENYKSSTKRMSETNDLKLSKQSKNFDRAKGKFESDSKDNLDFFSKKTAETIREKTRDYQSRLNEKRKDHEVERARMKEGLDDRLDYLKKNYDRNSELSDRNYNEKTKNSTLKYEGSLKANNLDFADALKGMDKKATELTANMKNEQDREKKVILRNNDEKLAKLASSGSISKNKMKDQFQKDLLGLRETQSDELEHRNDYQNERFKDLVHSKEIENKKLHGGFRNLTDELIRRNNEIGKNLGRKNRDLLTQKDKQFAKDLYQIRRDSQEKINAKDLEGGTPHEKSELIGNYQKKLKNMKSSLKDERYKAQLDKEKMSSGHEDTLRGHKIKSSKNLNEQEMSLIKNQTKYMKKMAKQNTRAVDDYRKELLNSSFQAEQSSLRDKKQAKKILENQRETFAKVVATIEQQKKEAISELLSVNAKEKTDFIEKSKQEHSNEMQEVKGELTINSLKKENALHQRLMAKEAEMKSIIASYEAKISRFKKKSTEELSSIRELGQQQKVEEDRNIKATINSMHRRNTLEKMTLKSQYEKRLSNTKNHNDTQVANIVERYESQLNRERKDLVREMKMKLTEAENNYKKLYEQSEMEKELIRNQFEVKFETIRESNAKALEESAREMRA